MGLYTSSVGAQHRNRHSHWIYKLRGSPAWKHTFTQEDMKGLWESSIKTSRYTSSVGVQHGNKHSHWIYKLRGSPAWKHTFTRENIHIGGDLVLTLGEQVEDNYTYVGVI